MHIRLKGDDNDVASKQEKFHLLATVKQKACEALTNFLARSCIEEVEVDEMDNKSVITMFIKALRVGDLYFFLRGTCESLVILMNCMESGRDQAIQKR